MASTLTDHRSLFKLSSTSAIDHRRRECSETIASLTACLVRLRRMSSDGDSHPNDNGLGVTSTTTTTSSTIDQHPVARFTRQPKTIESDSWCDEPAEDCYDHHVIPTSPEALVDSGYSSESSSSSALSENCGVRSRRRRRRGEDNVVDRQSKKTVSFADERGLQLVLVHGEPYDVVKTTRISSVSRSKSQFAFGGADKTRDRTILRSIGASVSSRQHNEAPAAVRLVVNRPDLVVGKNKVASLITDRGNVTERSRKHVAVDSICVDATHRMTVTGSVLVRSRPIGEGDDAQQKFTNVFVRASSDGWKTQTNRMAAYRCRLHGSDVFERDASDTIDGFIDVYVFEIPLKQPTNEVERRRRPVSEAESNGNLWTVEFAVAVTTGDERFQVWDNNNGKNYRVECSSV